MRVYVCMFMPWRAGRCETLVGSTPLPKGRVLDKRQELRTCSGAPELETDPDPDDLEVNKTQQLSLLATQE